jgi:hypothetical protein
MLKVRDRQQKMFGGNILVFEVRGLFEGLLEQFVGGIRKHGLSRFSRNFRKLLDFAIEFAENGLWADADFLQHRRNYALFILEQGGQQVNRQKLRVAVFGREFVRTLYCFLRFYCEFIPTDGHTFNSG